MANAPKPVSFRLPAEVKAAAEKAAADDHRSLSSLLEKLLTPGYFKDRPVKRARLKRVLRANIGSDVNSNRLALMG